MTSHITVIDIFFCYSPFVLGWYDKTVTGQVEMDYESLQFVTDVIALRAISIDVLDSGAVTGFTMNMNTVTYGWATCSLQFRIT